MSSSPYDAGFYEGDTTASASSAAVVVPMVAGWLSPSTVLDLGCGVGEWLAEWSRAGAEVLGADGDYVPRAHLRIPVERFQPADLSEPFDAERRFDLTMSVEVAEHIPAEKIGTFFDSLTRHSDAVLFSAAVPSGGALGVGHINEQWQSHWVALFEARGFELFDLLRPALWTDERVAWYYRQDLLLFARGDAAQRLRAVPAAPFPLDVAHPGMVTQLVGQEVSMSVRGQVKKLSRSTVGAVKRRVG